MSTSSPAAADRSSARRASSSATGFSKSSYWFIGVALTVPPAARKGMPRIDQRDEPGRIDVRIDLRRGYVGVTEQRLQHAEVRPSLQEMRRKGVPQHVWADLRRIEPGPRRQTLDELKQADARQVFTAGGEQIAPAGGPNFQPPRQRLARAGRDRHHALLRALAG